MTHLNAQLAAMRLALETAAPYAHAPGDPWTRPYRAVTARDLAGEASEAAFRAFVLTVRRKRPAPSSGLVWRPFEALLELAVLYPLKHQDALAEEYFTAEASLVRGLFEPPETYASAYIRLVEHQESDVLTLEGGRLLFLHRFLVRVDEPL